MYKQNKKVSWNRPLTKTQKIDLLLVVNTNNDGKILMARDFFFYLMTHYPQQSRQFKGTIEIGKLLEQTTIESIKQSAGSARIYLCSTSAKRQFFYED